MKNTKRVLIFIGTILVGYLLFIIPDVFFGITKINGGKIGINLFLIAVFQFASVICLLYFSLKKLKLSFAEIGLRFKNLKMDIFLGCCFGVSWTIAQFVFIIPNTGGADRLDIQGMLGMYDGSIIGTISFISLGVIGGGVTEEIFNRGYFITVLKGFFGNPRVGIWFSSILSIALFTIGHMPTSLLYWFDILVPTITYTLLFIYTKRLTASIVAHGLYNLLAIILTYFLYYN